MEVVLWQILQWVLRIILFLLLLIVVLMAIILIVPIRYRAEGFYLEKQPGIKGKVTWFFCLIYMKFHYDKEFCMQLRVFGFKVFDSMDQGSNTENGNIQGDKTDSGEEVSETEEKIVENSVIENEKDSVTEIVNNKPEDELAAWEKEMEEEAKEEAELAKQMIGDTQEEIGIKKEKKSFSHRIDAVKSKISDIIQKVIELISKIKDGKLKVEHYLELWNRNETQITFRRAKTKFGRMLKAVLPRKWILTGEVGFENPATTGQFMGCLGAMYPFLGNKVQVVPDFENQVIKLEGNVKGHIRLGNLLYQVISLLLNRHCFKVIKMVFDELGSSQKTKGKQSVK